jgi:hypothetical protein
MDEVMPNLVVKRKAQSLILRIIDDAIQKGASVGMHVVEEHMPNYIFPVFISNQQGDV